MSQAETGTPSSAESNCFLVLSTGSPDNICLQFTPETAPEIFELFNSKHRAPVTKPAGDAGDV